MINNLLFTGIRIKPFLTISCYMIFLLSFFYFENLKAQEIESPVLVFNRGMLWNSVYFGKIGPNFSNWGRRGIGLDWPGFD